MNILDKQSPSAANGSSSACAVSAAPLTSGGSMTPSSVDCLIPSNSQQLPPSTAPSSVSSTPSAPHTPNDTLNGANCQTDLSSSTLLNRPNVSTPSSVQYNNSAPNTPMPCASVGSDANITSPALNQLDYGDKKMFPSGPAPPSQALGSNNISNPVLSPSSLNVPQSMCNDNKKAAISNGGNKKHCNRNQPNNFAGINIKCENNNPHPKNQINFNAINNMSCNGSHLNGSVSPFDAENKMGGAFVKPEFADFSPPAPNEMLPSMGNMQRQPNCPMPPNMMNPVPGKMCGGNMAPHGMAKVPPMDSQYAQNQSQIFVFTTDLANQAADAISRGQFDSIIDFHLANPRTRNLLGQNMKYQNQMQKPNNFWPGNYRQPMRMRGPNPNGMCARGSPCYPPFNPNSGGGPQPPWNGPNQNGNWHNQPPSFGPNDMNMKMSNCPPRPYDQQFHGNFNNAHYPLVDMHDLTPQQKQHRETKLAILANLQQEFCPELMESNNRPLSQNPQQNEFSNLDPMISNNPNQGLPILPDNEQLNQMMPSDNFNSSFPPNNMMNNQPANDQWQKSNTFPDEKPPQFNGRRKGSQTGNLSSAAHQSPLSQQSINSPNSCITSSPSNRVPPPPYNSGHRPISSPHPASPAGTSLSLPSPRMHTNDTRQSNFPPGGIRSGPATPSADNPNCALINSPKPSHCNNSSNRPNNTNTSPGNKKSKSSIDSDMNMLNSFQVKSELLPVPSPKQIDFINIDGQELTIHKQPNAHFQENDLLNSNDLSNDIFPNDFANVCLSANNTQNIPPDMNPSHRFSMNQSCNFDMPNPKFSEGPSRFNRFPGEGQFRQSNACPPQFNQNEDIGGFGPNSMVDMNFPNSIPPMNSEMSPFPNGPNHPYNDHPDNSMSSTHLQNLQKMTPPFDIKSQDGMMPNSKPMPPNVANSGNNHMVSNSMHPNMPQNHNHRVANFDMPCNEMNEPNNFPGPNIHHPPNMQMGYPPGNFGNSARMPSNLPPSEPHFGGHPNSSYNMPMNGPMDPNHPNVSNSMPMIQGPQPNLRFSGGTNRPVNPTNTHNTRFNSPNIQVKPDAPNTIQYLPSTRPQGPSHQPPTKPNLDFLQHSLSMNNNKPPNNNAPYFANNPGQMMPRPMQNHMNFNRPPFMRPQNGSMPGQPPLPSQSNEMFGRPPGPPNMMNGPNMPMNAAPPNNYGPPGQVPNKPNSVPPMHDSSPPFNFNRQPFPNTPDPNYDANFLNFQQQLYATNSRNSKTNSNCNPR